MKKTKILIIFLIALVITTLNLISINISTSSFINPNIQNQELLLQEKTKESSHVLLHVTNLHQTGAEEAKATLTITDTNASKDKLLGLYVYSKISYAKFINKKMDIKEGSLGFGLKHVTIHDLIQGEQDILFTAKYKDIEIDEIKYINN